MKSGRPWHMADSLRPAEAERAARTPLGLNIGVGAAATVDRAAMAAVVPLAWLVTDGFLENRLGQLTWHGSTDLSLMLLLLAAAGLGLGIGRVGQVRRGRRRRGR